LKASETKQLTRQKYFLLASLGTFSAV